MSSTCERCKQPIHKHWGVHMFCRYEDAAGYVALMERTFETTPERHYHVAKYEGNALVRDCGACGLDLTHPSHVREAGGQK